MIDDDERASSAGPLALVGAGAAARALGELLSRGARPRTTRPLVVWSRRPAAARRLASRLGGTAARSVEELMGGLGRSATVLVCVSDPAVAAIAEQLAAALARRGAEPGPVILHTSGSLGREVLAPLGRRASGLGVLHPLVALPRKTPGPAALGRSFSRAWISVEGDPAARRRARQLVRLLGSRELRLREGADRARYHATAALVAGGLVALVDAAGEALASELQDPDQGPRALGGLAASVLANLARGPALEALTGPVARGDLVTVERHLGALAGGEHEPGDAARLYRELGRRLARLGRERGSLDGTAAARLLELLSSS